MYLQNFFSDYRTLFTNPANLIPGSQARSSEVQVATPQAQNWQLGLWYLFHGLWFSIIIGSVLSTLTFLIARAAGYNTEETSMVVDFIAENTLVRQLLLAVVLAPLIEEPAFRLWISDSKYYFSAGLVFLILFLYSATNSYVVLIATLALIAPIIAVTMLKSETAVQKFLRSKFRILVLTSISLFALSHIVNFVDVLRVWYLIPVLVWTQFFSGTLYALLRIRLGFAYAVALHALFNAFVIIFIYLFGSDFLF